MKQHQHNYTFQFIKTKKQLQSVQNILHQTTPSKKNTHLNLFI